MASSYPGDPSAPLPPHLDPRGRHHHRGDRQWGSAASRIALTFFTLLSIGALVLAGYYFYTFRNINKGVHRLRVAVDAPPSGKADIDGQDQNILLVGNDDRTNMTDAQVKRLKVGRGSGSKATDTMMIVHLPADGSKATLISLPRDSYVKIPDHGMNKLNSAYLFGYNETRGAEDERRLAGANLLIKTVTDLTGLTINHYIQVSLMGFYDISNAIGGVPVNLCQDVNDTKAANGGDGGSGLVISKGKHNIKGTQALEFVRQRHGLQNGDLDRVRRQQYFLTASFRKVASVGILFKLKALGDAVKRNVYLDPGLDLIDLARQMEKLSANNIVGKTIPFEGFDNDSPVGSVEVVNPHRVQRFVEKVINGPAPRPSDRSSGVSQPHGSGRSAQPPADTGSTTTKTPKALDSKCIN